MWTEEKVGQLRKYWAEGLSASQIARELGGVTRNAVIGKVHRLGLAGRATPSRPAKRPVRLRPPRPPRMVLVKAAPVHPTEAEVAAQMHALGMEPLPLANGRTPTVFDLNDFVCRYPIGDPTERRFGFCGRGVKEGRVYCADHAQLCYQPSKARKRAPRPPSGLQQLRQEARREEWAQAQAMFAS